MIYYVVFAMIGALGVVLILFPGERQRLAVWLFACVVLVVLGGLRFGLGADWEPYRDRFEEITYVFSPGLPQQEYLYQLVAYLVAKATHSYQVFIFVVFVLAFGLKAYVVSRYSLNVALSILAYFADVFLYFDVNAIRQGLALGFTCAALIFVVQRRPRAYLLLAGLAVLTHVSALVFLPFYWVADWEARPRTYLLIVLGLLVASPALVRLSQHTSVLELVLNDQQAARYLHYSAHDLYGKSVSFLALAQRLAVFVAFLALYPRIRIPEVFKRALLNGYFLSVIVVIAFGDSQEIGIRLAYFYKILDILILPTFLSAVSGVPSKVAVAVGIVGFCLVSLVRILSPTDGMLLPYANVLFR